LPDSPRITFRQAADVAVFERPLGPQDDHDRLFAVGRHRGDVVVIPGDMVDPEVDLREGKSGNWGVGGKAFGLDDIRAIQKSKPPA